MRLKALCVLLVLVGYGAPALAQSELFGDGKPPVFKEAEADRRFSRSRVGKLLAAGTDDPNCAQLVGGLLTLLAEAGPTIHKRDADFTLDPTLLQALMIQLSTPGFPGAKYLATMVRRVQLDRRLPQEWMETALQLNKQVRIIDVARLGYLADGLRPIDSFAFTLPALRDLHDREVVRATSAAGTSEMEFRDKYLDREIAWGGLKLINIGPVKRGGKKGKARARAPAADDEGGMMAVLQWEPPPSPEDSKVDIFAVLGRKKKKVEVHVNARLSEKQYVDIYKLPQGTRLMVRGRLWEMDKAVNELEVRDAVLFLDRDWSQGTVLADPNAVARCPAAMNELDGVAPGVAQPGGFGQH